MREIIQEEIGRFEMTDPYPKENGYVGEKPVMLFEDFVQYLNDLEEDLCKRYSGITCELNIDWDCPHWLVIYGKRYETKDEEQARLNKEKSDAEKKEAKRLARIKKLEQELVDTLLPPEPPICSECGCEIDEDICWCGAHINEHHLHYHCTYIGPRGCMCNPEKSWPYRLKD